MKKLITCLMIILTISLFTINAVWAAFDDLKFDDPKPSLPTEPTQKGDTGKLDEAIGNAWSTFASVVQVLAVGAVVFAGLRYMFAAPDQRADIKKGLSYLAIGAAFVFCASTIARFIVDAGDHII